MQEWLVQWAFFEFDKGCWLAIFYLELNICITSTMDYNWIGIGIRIGFPASSSIDYIREQFITSTSNKFNQWLQVSTYTNKDLSWARVFRGTNRYADKLTNRGSNQMRRDILHDTYVKYATFFITSFFWGQIRMMQMHTAYP